MYFVMKTVYETPDAWVRLHTTDVIMGVYANLDTARRCYDELVRKWNPKYQYDIKGFKLLTYPMTLENYRGTIEGWFDAMTVLVTTMKE